MRPNLIRVASVLSLWVVAALSMPSPRALALIKTKMPLKDVLASSAIIFEARVAKVDPEKRRLVLAWSRDLEGRTNLAQLNVNLAGDKVKNAEDPEKVFRRVRADLPVVVFASAVRDEIRFLVFTEGSWLSLSTAGKVVMRDESAEKPDAKAACRFEICEIYLRRTFAGTTKELLALLQPVLAGKEKPPAWDGKAKPGLGPELVRGASDGGDPPPPEKRDAPPEKPAEPPKKPGGPPESSERSPERSEARPQQSER